MPIANTRDWDVDVNTHANSLESELQADQLHGQASSRRRKTHLSEETWTLILAKKTCYKQLRRIRRHRDLGFLRTIFGRWKSQATHHTAPALYYQSWIRWSWHEEARLTFLYHRFAKATTPAVRKDDAKFYDDLARRAGETDSIGGLKNLWKELKATLPKSLNRKKLNTATQQPDAQQLYAHFDQLEAGEPTSFAQLVSECVKQQTSLRESTTTSLCLQDFPSRIEVERLCGRVKVGKAPGLDGIQPSQVKGNTTVVGLDLFYLMFKMWASAEEPASWKGGMLWPLWKGKGPKQSAASYRGIVLLPVLGKRWHALLRSRVLPHALQHRPPMQFGGFPGQQPGFASFIVRGYSACAKMHRLSDACILLDLRAAFHHLIRHLAMEMGNEEFPEALSNALRQDGFSSATVQQHCRQGERPGPLPLPTHLGKLTADLHRFTWYTLAGTNQVSHTHRGTRPGSPFADLGFNAYMGQIMLSIQQVLLEDRELEEAAELAGLPPTVVGWVDDVAIPICATSPQLLVEMIQRITERIIQVVWQAGFKINLDKGKTECLANFRGHGAPLIRKRVFIEQEGKIEINTPPGLTESPSLSVVGRYTHLGTCLGQDLNMAGEIGRRIGQAQTSFRMLLRPVFRNKRISIPSRFQLLESMVCTRLFYNSGVWGPLAPGLGSKIQHAMVGWYRQIIGDGFWCTSTTADAQLMRLWSIPTIPVRIAISQLRFCLAAFRQGRTTVWEFIRLEAGTGPSSWFAMLTEAVKWFKLILPTRIPEEIDVDNLSPGDLANWFEGPLTPTRAVFKLLLRKHLLQERSIAEVRDGYMQAFEIFRSRGLARVEDHGVIQGGAHRCSECSASFPRAQQLQAHRWSKHQGISLERRYVFGPTCRACGMKFWTSQRMQQHLRYSRRFEGGCLELLYNYVEPTEEAIGFGPPLHLQHIRRLPAIQDGQMEEMTGLTLTEQLHARQLAEWTAEWAEQGLPATMDEALWTEAKRLLSFGLSEWAMGRSTSSDLVDTWATALEDMQTSMHVTHVMTQWFFLRWYQQCMADDMSEWMDPDQITRAEADGYDLFTACPLHHLFQRKPALVTRWKNLPPASTCGIAAPKLMYSQAIYSAFYNQNEYLADLLQPTLYQSPDRPPLAYICGQDGSKILFVIHVFSGRRRSWDFHHWMDELSAKILPEWTVKTLSFDTAVDGVDGNLLGSNFLCILRLAGQGVFAGAMGGPPCETFSPARHLEKPEGVVGHWPRPLRSTERLWGIDNLSLRELEQLRVGSKLYIHNTLVDLQVVQAGGYSLLEHPADPVEQPKPSSWQSGLHKTYAAALHGFRPIRIDQWKYGAESVKPTVIRSMGGTPTTKRELLRFQRHDFDYPLHKLAGTDSTGKFRTAAAKEYPWLLSKALASTLLHDLARGVQKRPLRCIDFSTLGHDFEWLIQYACKSSCICSSATWLPDYQR